MNLEERAEVRSSHRFTGRATNVDQHRNIVNCIHLLDVCWIDTLETQLVEPAPT